MRPILILPLLCVAGAAKAQTFDYRVFIGGKPAGTVRSTFTSKKGFIEDSNGQLKQGGTTVKVRTRTELDGNGNWRLKIMEAEANGKSAKATATPTAAGAHVVLVAGGKSVSRHSPCQ